MSGAQPPQAKVINRGNFLIPVRSEKISQSSGAALIETSLLLSAILFLIIGVSYFVFYHVVAFDLQRAVHQGARAAANLPILAQDDLRVAAFVRNNASYSHMLKEQTNGTDTFRVLVRNSFPEIPSTTGPIYNSTPEQCNRVVAVFASGIFEPFSFNPIFWRPEITISADATVRYSQQPLCD